MADDHSKLKLKIGAHEFEAEGPTELVKEQLAAFKEMIATIPSVPASGSRGGATPTFGAPSSYLTATGTSPLAAAQPALDEADFENALPRIMKLENRIVSLTVRASSIDQAVLLIVYGQKAMRNNDSVTGAEVMDGLTATGLRVPRVDRLLEKAGENGDVIVIGVGRAKRYRLTNTGLTKARAIAAELLATVA